LRVIIDSMKKNIFRIFNLILGIFILVGVQAFAVDSDDEREVLGHRVVFIYDSACTECPDYRTLVKKAFKKLIAKNPQWNKKLTVWDTQADSKKVQNFIRVYGKGTKEITLPILVAVTDTSVERRLEPECGTPLEAWTLEWLLKGKGNQPEGKLREKGRYPVSGGWWSVEGDWNPSPAKIRRHLIQAPNHDRKFESWWLDLLVYEELQSVHSDHHREQVGSGKVHWDYVNVAKKEQAARQPSSVNRTRPVSATSTQ